MTEVNSETRKLPDRPLPHPLSGGEAALPYLHRRPGPLGPLLRRQGYFIL